MLSAPMILFIFLLLVNMKIHLSNYSYANDFQKELLNAINNLKDFYLTKKQIVITDKDILFTIEETYDGLTPVVYVPSLINKIK